MLVALGFLTRVPVGRRGRADLGAGAWAFPLVGALVGLVVGAVGVGGSLVLPVLVAAALAVAAEVLLTGALHLDGLADCADGCGGRDRAARLRIMKDHAVGVYGTTAVVLDLLTKTALVHALVSMLPGWAALTTLVVAYALSRTVLLPLARWLPSARPEGTGSYLVRGLTHRGVAAAGALALGLVTLTTLALAGVLPEAAGAPVPAAAWLGPLVAALGGLAGAATVAVWARRTLGGVTGDVLGAATETALLLALLGTVLVGGV